MLKALTRALGQIAGHGGGVADPLEGPESPVPVVSGTVCMR